MGREKQKQRLNEADLKASGRWVLQIVHILLRDAKPYCDVAPGGWKVLVRCWPVNLSLGCSTLVPLRPPYLTRSPPPPLYVHRLYLNKFLFLLQVLLCLFSSVTCFWGSWDVEEPDVVVLAARQYEQQREGNFCLIYIYFPRGSEGVSSQIE
jgi:hypothetical protein